MRKISKTNTTNGSEVAEDRDSVEKNGEPEISDDEAGDDGGKPPARDSDAASDADEPLKKPPKKRGRHSKKKKDEKSEDEEEDEEEYEVEKVIDSKKIKGRIHYLIRWKGYTSSSDTWEPDNTLSCPELIEAFNDENKGSKTKKSPKKSLKRKAGRPSKKTPSKKAKNQWDSENADENAEYEVDRILEVHHKKNGKREFLIHWKGWSTKFDSWEPEDNLNCSELINKFMDKVDNAKSSDSRSLRAAPGSTKRFTLQSPGSGRRLSKRRGQKQRVRYDDAE